MTPLPTTTNNNTFDPFAVQNSQDAGPSSPAAERNEATRTTSKKITTLFKDFILASQEELKLQDLLSDFITPTPAPPEKSLTLENLFSEALFSDFIPSSPLPQD